MKSLVPQFQEELAFGGKKASDLLRMAQLISAKLKLDDILQWIGHKLNGYPADSGTVPEYRYFTGGSLQVYNPYSICNPEDRVFFPEGTLVYGCVHRLSLARRAKQRGGFGK